MNTAFVIKHKSGGYIASRQSGVDWFGPYCIEPNPNSENIVLFNKESAAQELLDDDTGYGIGRDRTDCTIVYVKVQPRFVELSE